MSLPPVQQQRSLFEVNVQFAGLFKSAPANRFGFFSDTIMPQLRELRPQLEAMYCADNGRPAEEPSRMLAVLILQFMEGLPDRKAVEACTYDLRWKMALWMETDEAAFHATSLVKFRNRLLEHNLVEIGFDAVLQAMRKAGYLKAHKAQRLDSTHVIGLVSHMSRLECVREAMRLAMEVLAELPESTHPGSWSLWWERYVQSALDFKTDVETLKQKMTQAGEDARAILAWIETQVDAVKSMKSVSVLRRVYEENFQQEVGGQTEQTHSRPSGAVYNPHDPDAQWSAKGTIAGKNKEWVGYKAQIAETLPSAKPEMKAPTDAVITAMVTQPAITSDHGSISDVEEEWKREDLDKPKELYVDGGYISGEALADAGREEREIHGPVQPAPKRGDRFSAESFDVDIDQRVAICPARHASTNCSRLDEVSGKIHYRFEWNNHLCQACELRSRCLGANQRHRTLLVGQYHSHIQARRREMKTGAFKERMHKRNGVEGTISELKRGYGLRRCRYRGLIKTSLQNYLIGAACNIKRWARRLAWEALGNDEIGIDQAVRA
ncbi:MAG: transposase [Kiritimatiellae bacterium]|nr:transposase [Kiritimatiellia bacterium]